MAAAHCPQVQNLSACWAAALELGVAKGKGLVNSSASDPKAPAGCSVSTLANGSVAVHLNAKGQAACKTPAAAVRSGEATSAVLVGLGLTLDPKAALATIRMSGPANAWFGVGLNARDMADQPYTIIVSPDHICNHICNHIGNHRSPKPRPASDRSQGSGLGPTTASGRNTSPR